MLRRSAGVLLHRMRAGEIEVLLVHPGGPFWRNKDTGAWQLPKGKIEAGEEASEAAQREAAEELGTTIDAELVPLGDVRQAGGKLVTGFAVAQDLDADGIVSSTVEIEWPYRSGKRLIVPEIDAAKWLTLSEARRLMLPSQKPLLDRLEQLLRAE